MNPRPDLNFWRPVCALHQAADLPFRYVYQDLAFVVWVCDGVAYALEDRCAHRDVRLSTGRPVGHAIACSAHEWRFDGEGHCVFSPSATGSGARVRAFETQIHDGVVWARIA